jgi:hypothetical protein
MILWPMVKKAEGRGQKAEMVREHVKFLTIFIAPSFHLSPIINPINFINPINLLLRSN